MKVPVVSTSHQEAINSMFSSFARNCIGKTKNNMQLKDEFLTLNRNYTKSGLGDTFLYKSERLSCHLLKNGNLKLANIFINELGKIYLRIGNAELAEKTILKSLRISELLNDELHVLARCNDLEYLYKALDNKEKLFKLLQMKKNCAKRIVRDYEKCAKNFNSLMREPTSLESVKKQLAFTYNDMADILVSKRPKDSIKMVEKAKEIYKELGQQKEVNFLTIKMQIIERNMKKRQYTKP